MLNREELLKQGVRAWPRFLRSLITGEPFFPLSIRIGKTHRREDYPGRKDELTRFRADAQSLQLEILWRKVRALRFGVHELPEQACWKDEASFLCALGKSEDARHFREDIAIIRDTMPRADEWIVENVLAVTVHHGNWPALMRVVAWIRENPRCGLYLRQLPIRGVDTKFFENRTGILDSLLIHENPGIVNLSAVRFEERPGLRWEQPLVRFRFLDHELRQRHGFPIADLAVPLSIFRQLPLANVIAIITENLRNFLALPPVPNGVAVFGGGNAIPLLANSGWLNQSRILYWGDIDTYGFLILDRLRDLFPHAESFLMNSETFDRWAALGITGPTQPLAQPKRLNLVETEFFKRVASENIQLEQERIPFDFVVQELEKAITPCLPHQ